MPEKIVDWFLARTIPISHLELFIKHNTQEVKRIDLSRADDQSLDVGLEHNEALYELKNFIDSYQPRV